MNNQNKKGFTLVELIVTIVILAILWTIAFISFQWYSKNARDTQRIADINHVEKSLWLFVVNTWFYPNPDKSKDITYWGWTAWIEWTLWDTVLKNIDKVSKTPLDPLTWNEYTYSITPSKTEYQIGAISEVGWIALNSIFTDKIYAADLSKAVAYMKWNYNEKITRIHTWNTNLVLAIPSIIVTDITDPKLENILPKKILVYNNYWNIPHSYNPMWTMTWELEYNPTNLVVFSGATIDLTASNDKIDFVTNLQNAYSGTFVEDNVAYSELMSIDPVSDWNSAISLVNSYLTYNVWWITWTQTAIVYNDCTLDWQTISHNQTITAYSENNILSWASYECTDRAIERTCNNGLLSWDDSYTYKTCVKWIPSNCEASWSYIYAWHTYNIPIINHWETATNLISSEVTETTWVYTYTLSSITCNDGSLINPIESGTTAVVSCNIGYTTNGTTCVWSTYTVTLDANGWTAWTTSVTSTYNASMPTITVLPTRTWYTFNWYYSATSWWTKYYNSDWSSAINYLLTSWTTLYAQWTVNTYTVTLSANGWTAWTTSVTSTYNASMPTIAVLPTRTWYTFNWYYSATSGWTKYYNSDWSSAISYLLTSWITLYAQWTANTYTVTLSENWWTAWTTSVISTYSTSMPTITVLPTRTWYAFNWYYSATSGWTKYYNADGSSAISYLLTSWITLYAQWTANTYTVTLSENWWTAWTTSVISTYSTSMPTITVLPTRTWYTFNWYYSATSWWTKYYNSDWSSAISYLLTSGTTLYAQWTANTYIVSFNWNWWTLWSTWVLATYWLSMPIYSSSPTRTWYSFTWFYNLTSWGTKYYNFDKTSASIWNVASDTTLYAQWMSNIYTVSWNFWTNASWATINVCGTNVIASSTWTFNVLRNYWSVCNTISATKTWYSCTTSVQWPASLTTNVTNIAWSCIKVVSTIEDCTAVTQTWTALTRYWSCSENDIILCSWVWVWYIIAACNVWTDTAWTTSASYGYYFQWWNNWWTPSWTLPLTTSTVDASSYWPWNYYNSTTFIWWASLPATYDWTDPQNNNLWWDVTNTDESRQWPCQTWYHIPSETEWVWIISSGGWNLDWSKMRAALKLPLAWNRNRETWTMRLQWTTWHYWASSADWVYWDNFYFTTSSINYPNKSYRVWWNPVRCILN